MFLFRKKQPLKELFKDYYDIHSHLLPGVDDGSKTLEQSNSILANLEQLGVKGVWCTPHIMVDIYPDNTKLKLENAFAQFAHTSSIDVRLGAEYMIDDAVLTHFDQTPLMLGENSVLIEFSTLGMPGQAYEIIFDISLKGYSVILAHPERYSFLQRKESKKLQKLENAGCLFQLNLGSLSGLYGARVQQFALWMLKEGKYSYSGSDVHNQMQLNMLCDIKLDRSVATALERVMAQNRTLYSACVPSVGAPRG